MFCSKETIIDTIVKATRKKEKQEMTFPKYQNTGRIAYIAQMANRPVPDE